MINEELLLQADINNITEQTIMAETPSTTTRDWTLSNIPEPPFQEIVSLISEKSLYPIKRVRLS